MKRGNPFEILILIVILFLPYSFLNPLVASIVNLVIIVLYSRFYLGKKIIKPFIIAFFVAFIWAVAMGDYYQYKKDTLQIFNINPYPLLTITLGLSVSYLLYLALPKNFKNNILKKLFFFFISFVLLMLTFETVAYHLFGIQLNADYPGLPICNCLHGPVHVKIGYFSFGLIYFALLAIFDKKSLSLPKPKKKASKKKNK